MILASVIAANTFTGIDDIVYGELYIILTDSTTGNPVNGDNIRIYYYFTDDGVRVGDEQLAVIPGSSNHVYSGWLQKFTTTPNLHWISISRIEPADGPPGFCDASISSVTINQQETSPGADNGIATVNATSTFGPIQYSLDDSTFQDSPTFTGLTGGAYTAYIKDANDCETSFPFFIPIASSLLVSGPEYTVSPGNVSRWNAAFCPVVFTYQRKDFGINSIISNSGKIDVEINADMTNVQVGDYVYIKATGYDDTGAVLAKTGNVLTLDIVYVANTSDGFANINKLRKNYKVLTKIFYVDKITNRYTSIISTNTPNQTGLVKADIATFVQSILRTTDESNYTQLNFRDDNLSASYTVSYTAVWEGQAEDYIPIADPYYVTFTGSKLGQQQGLNMNQYVPFPAVPAPSLLAKWVTDFERPTYNNGFPFDIGFIYSENIAGLQIKASITQLDINGNPIGSTIDYFLLNENGSFIVNLDASKYIIAKQNILTPSGAGIVERVGLNRLLINQDFGDQVYSLKVYLYYLSGDDEIKITQDKYIDIGKECDTPMYMRWIGLNGCWDYWKFTYNQDVQLDVQNATIVKEFVSNWVNQTNIEKVIAKQASEKVVVYAASIPIEKIQGLQAIKYSPEVQLLVNLNPIKWQTMVLNTATFNEFSTHWNASDFSVTFNKPSINIQNQ